VIHKDDFEHRLGQGLKRWAEAAHPTMDLQAHVTAQEPATAAPANPPRSPLPRLRRLVIPFAAAAALLLTTAATFPVWAGAAAGWPIVGPVVTEIILKDAGMKWAYEAGLIRGSMAEVREGDVTVRILGVLADSRRTSVIYQIQGVPGPEDRSKTKPIQAGPSTLFTPPGPQTDEPPTVTISKVDGQGGFSSWTPPTWTKIGYVGTVNTLPLPKPTTTLELTVNVGTKHIPIVVEASRADVDRLSQEVPVNQSVEIAGIKITVEAVTHTPAETVVQYKVERPEFWGPLQWDPKTEFHYIDTPDGRRLTTPGSGGGVNNQFREAFPPVEGPAKFVVPVEVKGVPANLRWPLRTGAVQRVGGTTITLTQWERSGDAIGFEWEAEGEPQFMGFAEFAVVDASGQVFPLGQSGVMTGNNRWPDGKLHSHISTRMPEGVIPVAVTAGQYGWKVDGPWVFELPR